MKFLDIPPDMLPLVAACIALTVLCLAWVWSAARQGAKQARYRAEIEIQQAVTEEQTKGLESERDRFQVEAVAFAAELKDTAQSLAEANQTIAELKTALAQSELRRNELVEAAEKSGGTLEEVRQLNGDLRQQLSVAETRMQEERKQADEKLAILNEARERLGVEFKQLANEILEQKSKKFTEQNQENIESVLKPLSGQIESFKKRVEETYDRESKDRFSLKREIENLQKLNSRIAEDAVNLTNALKGESKTQGVWGELQLEKILEASGLVKGREYDVQVSVKDEDGKRLQPDVLVHLPDNKDIIIDSKVTLTDYHRYISAESDDDKHVAAQQHLQSLYRHIKDLSSKDYQKVPELRTLDFVLMFLPIENAFSLAVQKDPQVFSKAFEHNIILVGPSTLLATLRTIQHTWRNEYQTQNAQQIAKRAGDMYDKFVNFVADLEEIGLRLGKAQDAYDKAHNKLADGRGNLIGRAEAIRELGAKTNKQLPKHLSAQAEPSLQIVDMKDKS